MNLYKADFYHKEGTKICCDLCPHKCRLKEGAHGICGVRKVANGELYSLNYGICAAMAMDPIEKKPLYHFYPGGKILSLGTWGCNLNCNFCQNWSLARGNPSTEDGSKFTEPENILETLKSDYPFSIGIAYTYNEPTVWFEYLYDTARLVTRNGYKNVLVTNGFISPEALEKLSPYIDALNIDLKSFNKNFYRKYCGGELESVKKTIENCSGKFHLEITTLIIPTLNDSFEEIAELIDWLSNLNPDIPIHFSRYFPQYKCSLPPTPIEKLLEIRNRALKRLNYVYVGNAGGVAGSANTYCPDCKNLLINREDYPVDISGFKNGNHCSRCGYKIQVVGNIIK